MFCVCQVYEEPTIFVKKVSRTRLATRKFNPNPTPVISLQDTTNCCCAHTASPPNRCVAALESDMHTADKLLQQLSKASTRTPLYSLEGHADYGKCVRCYDADSIHVVFSLSGQLTRFRCRLAGIDTPELRSSDPNEREAAKAAREYLSQNILDHVVWVECGGFDKYGRLLVNVFDAALPPSSNSASDCVFDHCTGGTGSSRRCWNKTLVALRHAREYDGGKRVPYRDWIM